jgi:hypothetical protein
LNLKTVVRDGFAVTSQNHTLNRNGVKVVLCV